MSNLPQAPGIYVIYNSESNKYYIGQSNNINRRWRTHKYAINNNSLGDSYLMRAYRKYDVSVFTCTCLEQFDINIFTIPQLKNKLTERESFWISEYRSQGKVLYNTADPQNTQIGYVATEEAKQARSEKYRGEGNGSAKLTEQQAIDILTLDKDLSLDEVAEKYNITYACAKDLRLRRSWQHLDIAKVASRCIMSDDTKAKLTADLINQTIPNEDLCVKYGISMSSVQKLKHSLGLTDRNGKQLKIREYVNGNKGKTLEYAQGTNNVNCKLDADKVRDIKLRLANKESCASIGRLYDVSNVTISNIRDGKVWKHI